MAFAQSVVATIAAAILVSAGIAKLAAPSGLQRTLAQVGIPVGPLRRGGGLLGLVEVATALLVCVTAGILAATLLVVLGSIFALLGAYALLTGSNVPCNCFATVRSESRLGLRQILWLPAWLVAAGAVAFADPVSLSSGFIQFNLAVALSFAVYAVALRPLVAEARVMNAMARPHL